MPTAKHALIFFLASLLLLSSCASQPAKETQEEPEQQEEILGLNPSDPWENVNRKIFAFNDVLDRYIARPVAVAYDTVTPDVVQSGVRNFFSNLGEVYNLVNNTLQFDFEGAGTSVMRFTVNTLFGFGGLLDIASEVGMKSDSEDFGQTLAVWGIQQGNYIVVPFLGPSTTRDIFGYVDRIPSQTIDGEEYDNPLYIDRFSYITRGMEEGEKSSTTWGLTILDLIQFRASLLSLEDSIIGDRYVFIRDAYLQNRNFRVNDGAIEEDDFLDEESEGDEDVSEDDF